MKDEFSKLLEVVIENYIKMGDPVGSKYLNSLQDMDYAPSTLRKYLNLLENNGFLYQPYNSAGRVPTVKAFSTYIENVLYKGNYEEINFKINTDYARNSLKFIVESLGNNVDGAVVGLLRNDEYYFLGINNILSANIQKDYETVKYIIDFIEKKKVIQFLNKKMLKKNIVNYSFVKDKGNILSSLYIKIDVNGYDGIIAVLSPVRVNYKKNLGILKKFIKVFNQ